MCLIKTEVAVDVTGASYYGESRLFLLSDKIALDLLPPKEGAIHDVKWSPKGDVFCLIAGKSPPRCTLFDSAGNALFEFGEAHRNVSCFSPHGRFLMIGGFGNLAGEMDFWDVYKKRKIGFNKSSDPPVGFEVSICICICRIIIIIIIKLIGGSFRPSLCCTSGVPAAEFS